MGYEPVTIREAARVEVLLFVGLAFVCGLLVVYWGFQTYQFGRVIRDTPPEPVQSVAMGRTEISGEVVPATRVYDQPFTTGRCVYGEFEVEEYKKSGDDDDKEWKTVQSDSFSTAFYIDDDTGQMLVEPNDDTAYEISDTYSTTIEVGRGDQPPEPVQEFLGSGVPESATGALSTVDDGGGIRARLGGLLGRFGVFGDDEEPMGGDPDAVDVDQREESDGIEHIRRHEIGTVSSTSRKRRYSQRVMPLSDNAYVFGGATRRDPAAVGADEDSVVVRTDPSTGEFVVSDRGEFELASTYRNRSYLYIAAGIVTSAFILALLVQILVTGPVYGIEAALP